MKKKNLENRDNFAYFFHVFQKKKKKMLIFIPIFKPPIFRYNFRKKNKMILFFNQYLLFNKKIKIGIIKLNIFSRK